MAWTLRPLTTPPQAHQHRGRLSTEGLADISGGTAGSGFRQTRKSRFLSSTGSTPCVRLEATLHSNLASDQLGRPRNVPNASSGVSDFRVACFATLFYGGVAQPNVDVYRTFDRITTGNAAIRTGIFIARHAKAFSGFAATRCAPQPAFSRCGGRCLIDAVRRHRRCQTDRSAHEYHAAGTHAVDDDASQTFIAEHWT